MTVFEEFVFWITSMTEDTPIPYEIKHLYFVLDFSNNYCVLSFAGSENKQNPFLNYEYFPLEAYHFHNINFFEIKDIYLAKITVKELIEQGLETKRFKKLFKNKHIYICEKFKEISHEFKTLN